MWILFTENVCWILVPFKSPFEIDFMEVSATCSDNSVVFFFLCLLIRPDPAATSSPVPEPQLAEV